ncbi:glycoside hydrolase family 30 protein [Chitinimonas sp. BJYL2]|uniref:glycoside hydrolase family 30 protein n=1 Tax=Chitinimonas sp. BJYL2 TaxID=2976696 RepID=UPI0022B30902|nr:glycoside hydrolase family 30 protein [Chitinimonas sp. BJYL2]
MNPALSLPALVLALSGAVLVAPVDAAPLPEATMPNPPAVMQVYTTARDTDLRLAQSGTVTTQASVQPPENQLSIFVNPAHAFQTVFGIGGAITDATAEVFAGLSADKQQALLQAYFDPVRGAGYTLLRTTIHSADFSSASYTYVAPGDTRLDSFDIEPDRRHRLPMIKRALATIASHGEKATVYASPWSAPAWMKDNNSMLKGGRLLPAYRDAWARYYARFIRAYEAEGVPIWGITVQNEPMAKQTWESMIYSAEEERDFLRDHLGPTLKREGLGDRKIIVWDHNRDLILHRADTILSDPEAAQYVWGVGFHWYETWAGGAPMHGNVAAVREAYPQVNLLLTEATVEGYDPARLQWWPNAERYGRQIIADFNAGAVGWTDWNLLLDERGGPNHVGNYCFAPIHADTRTGELILTPSYYYLAHFSRFVRPGMRRVSTVSSRSTLLTTAFADAQGQVVVLVMNEQDVAAEYRLHIGQVEASLQIPPRAIQTIRYALP